MSICHLKFIIYMLCLNVQINKKELDALWVLARGKQMEIMLTLFLNLLYVSTILALFPYSHKFSYSYFPIPTNLIHVHHTLIITGRDIIIKFEMSPESLYASV